jgi:PAS domain S-box-containing protein
MEKKRTYEELQQQRAKELEKEAVERKRAEEELQKYKFMVESAHDAIFFKDLDSRYVIANAKTLEAFGLSREEVIGKNDYELLIDPEEAKRNVEDDQIVLKTGKPKEITKHMTSADGKEYWFEAVKVPQADDKGNIIGLVGIARDISDRKRAEEHIRTLTQQLMKAQEAEWQRISRELHDNVAQDLSTAKIACETLFDNEPAVPSETRQRVLELCKILQGTIMAVRDLSYDLRPPSMDQLGLVRTVFQYCEDFSDKNGVRVDFYSAGMDDLRLDFNTEINLYRLIQEGLNNIRKHADANHVTIRLVASFPNIILRVEDDGKGFDVKDRLVTALHEKHMGLRSMEERVSLLQGKMRIQSRPMQGTEIFVEVPYKEKKSGSKEKHIDR